MSRRLVVVGGLLAFAIFGIWWFAAGHVRLSGHQATNKGVLVFHEDSTLFIFTGCDTTDIYFMRRDVDMRRYDLRSLDMQWEPIP